MLGAFEELVDVDTGDGEREKADGREDGVAAANAERDIEGFVVVFSGLFAEGAGFGVGGGDDAVSGFFLAVFFDKGLF